MRPARSRESSTERLRSLRSSVTAVPSAWPLIEAINNHILSGDLYLALKETKKLVAYEKQLLDQIEELRSKTDVSTAA